jgi:putative membrane protein
MMDNDTMPEGQPQTAEPKAAEPQAPATQTAQPAQPPAAGQRVFLSDAEVLSRIHKANLDEVALAKVAQQKAQMAEVKDLSAMIVRDHQKGDDDLTAFAKKQNITLSEPTPGSEEVRQSMAADNANLNRVRGLSGAEFDREYMSAMVDGHDDVQDKVGSRVDQSKLADWKTRMEESLKLKKETQAEAEAVVPEKSDDPVTMSVNQWAADAYPVVYKHLESAKSLNDSLKRGRTTQ